MIIKSLPNILTLSRIVVIPIIVGLFYLDFRTLCAILFLYASVTDFLDGYFARAWSMQTNLGRALDPIADKLLVGAVIIALLDNSQIDVFPSLAIICREILVSGLRELLAELRISVPVSNLAKIKTAVQMSALFLLVLGQEGGGHIIIPILGRIAIWIAAILTLITGYAYVKSGVEHLKE
ncbi:MAG: CDP-diacylglycerol--glycerol-3-phosphate 3-phosphatidyltransferase [Sphingobacteriia bacterium]|nr:CDP-diacylglycerol--glycerol-3-phosphate 3-phosphatidyltransferase [Sphingobacteriia bacterium]